MFTSDSWLAGTEGASDIVFMHGLVEVLHVFWTCFAFVLLFDNVFSLRSSMQARKCLHLLDLCQT